MNDLAVHQKQLRDTLVGHLWWVEMRKRLTKIEVEQLERYGETFGDEGLERKLETIMKRKLGGEALRSLRAMIEAKAKVMAERYVTSMALGGVVDADMDAENVVGDVGKKQFVQKYSQIAKPLVSMFFELGLMRDVLGKYFDDTEMARWLEHYEQHPLEAMEELKAEVETRSGKHWEELLEGLRNHAQTEVVKLVGGMVDDYRQLTDEFSNADELEQQLSDGRMGELMRRFVD